MTANNDRLGPGRVIGYDNVCYEWCDTTVHNYKQLECHDGNLIDGDGCSSKCKIEDGYSCFNSSESVN